MKKQQNTFLCSLRLFLYLLISLKKIMEKICAVTNIIYLHGTTHA